MGSARRLRVHLASATCLSAALIWTATVYWPILGSYFLADDFGNLFLAVNGAPLEYILEPSPGHILYLPRSCYFALYHLVGPDPRAFFASMLLTHLANVALLFALVRVLTRNEYLAGFAAALWGCLRVNEGTLGWYAVYGQVASTLTMLVVLCRLAAAAERGSVSLREVLAWYALLLLGCVSFGSAVPIAFVFPFVAWLVLPAGVLSGGARRLLASLPVAVPLGYAAAYGLYVAAYGHDDKQAPFIFSLIWRTLRESLVMTVHLLRGGTTALVVGVEAMPGDSSPLSYAIPALVAVGLVAGAAWSPPRARRWLAALLLLAVSVYVFIALGRVFAYFNNPAAGGWIARYHYVPTLLLVVAAALVLAQALDALGRPRAAAAALFVLWLGGTAVLWERGGWVIDQHPNMRAITETTLARIQTAIETAPGSGAAVIQNQPFQPHLATPYEIGGWAGLFSIFRPDGDRRPVFFAETRPEVRAKATPGSPMAALLLPPG